MCIGWRSRSHRIGSKANKHTHTHAHGPKIYRQDSAHAYAKRQRQRNRTPITCGDVVGGGVGGGDGVVGGRSLARTVDVGAGLLVDCALVFNEDRSNDWPVVFGRVGRAGRREEFVSVVIDIGVASQRWRHGGRLQCVCVCVFAAGANECDSILNGRQQRNASDRPKRTRREVETSLLHGIRKWVHANQHKHTHATFICM